MRKLKGCNSTPTEMDFQNEKLPSDLREERTPPTSNFCEGSNVSVGYEKLSQIDPLIESTSMKLPVSFKVANEIEDVIGFDFQISSPLGFRRTNPVEAVS